MPKLSKLSDKDVMYIFLIKEQVNFLSHVEKRLFKVDNAYVQYKSCPVVKEITFAFEYTHHTHVLKALFVYSDQPTWIRIANYCLPKNATEELQSKWCPVSPQLPERELINKLPFRK